MIGDLGDIRRRLRSTLPVHWFNETAPILDGVLSGISSAWCGLYQLLAFVIQQSRLSTATGQFLDMASQDYISDDLPRRLQEDDALYRERILIALQRIRATRVAIVEAAASAGYEISVFEAARPADTGAYNVPTNLAWNAVGAWGSMQMPLESLIVAQPQADHHEDELWKNLAHAAPSGGVIWLRIDNNS